MTVLLVLLVRLVRLVRLVLQTLSVFTLLAFVLAFVFVRLGLLPSFSKSNYFFSTDSKSSWNRSLD